MASPIVVPHTSLSEQALEGVIDEFVTREGTDYGLQEHSLEAKRKAVHRQLTRGEVVILFDPQAEAVTLVTRQELRELEQSARD